MANIRKTYKRTKSGKQAIYTATVRIPETFQNPVKSYSISKSFGKKSHAVDWQNETMADIKRGIWEDPRLCNNVAANTPKIPTVEAALIDYLNKVTVSKKSALTEENRIRAWLKRDIATKPINQVSTDDIRQFIDKRIAEGRAINTIKNDLQSLSGALSMTAFEHGITFDPHPVDACRDRRHRVLPPQEKSRQRRLTADEEAAMRQQLASRKHGHETIPLLDLALETGMRLGEMIEIRRAWIHGDFVHLPDTKNGEKRAVFLTARAKKALDALHGKERFFTIKRSDLENAWSAAREAAGIEDLRFHDLRHEAVSRMAAKKIPIHIIMRQSGHKSLSAMQIYLNASNDDVSETFKEAM